LRIPKYKEMTAVLTGSSGGIAFAAALALARAGVPRIMLNGRTGKTCQDAAETLRKEVPGVEVEFVAGDVTKAHHAERLIEQTVDRFKSIELLVNIVAGPAPPMPFHKVLRDSFDE
jgi:NAD(P)-dependent dehydrogenase (short-subunit alcohol dehydrogenase family)